MAKIFLISAENINLDGFELKSASFYYEEIYGDILSFSPDVVILDSSVKESNLILMGLMSNNVNKEFEIFYPSESFVEFKNSVKIILKPFDINILKNEIKISIENKRAYRELNRENLELKKNLYQIDAFYNASSKFAGTLEKEKLYEVTFESLERVLSYDAVCALFKDNFEDDRLKFYINSLKKTTAELNSNLIKRLSFASLNEGIEGLKSNRCAVDIIQKVKPSHKNEYFDSSLTNFDSLIAPVVIKDKFEGIIEIFRYEKFTKEDVTCFQSIIHQVLAPLRSAILYEEIINANKKLKKLEQMKSEFVSIVSHELRTPLTPINNALGIILSEEGGKIGEVNKNFANIAKRNVSRLSGIIEDLLDLSRIQTGKFDFKFKKTEITPSLELAFNTFKNQMAAKNIQFNLNCPEKLPEVYIDSHRIDQILSNLITNAVKFTPEKGKISVEAKVVNSVDKNILISPPDCDYSGNYVEISVNDTGVGIEEDDIPKIFDKFSQIENSLSRNTGGIGLGLTITKHFTDIHLGGIYVKSKKNEGSKFSILIPVYDENKAFEIDLNLKIKNEPATAYFKIEENNNSGFYQHLKDLNIVKLTKSSKELTYFADEKCITRVFMNGLDRGAFDFMVSKIEDEINIKDKSCDIVLSKAFYKNEHS